MLKTSELKVVSLVRLLFTNIINLLRCQDIVSITKKKLRKNAYLILFEDLNDFRVYFISTLLRLFSFSDL